MLSAKTFLQLTGTIFCIIGTLHLLRLIFGGQILLVGWTVPIWISFFGVLITWYLAYNAFTLAKKKITKK
jgi:hypothetical protein